MDEPKQPKYITHEQFARQRALRLIRKTPPPTRPPAASQPLDATRAPDIIEIQQGIAATEIEITGPGPVGQQQKIVVRIVGQDRATSNARPSYYELTKARDAEDSNESTYMALAVISLFVPCGFFLAIWPAMGSRGGAKTVALVCIFIHVALALLFFAAWA